jgi:hypothetical protein
LQQQQHIGAGCSYCPWSAATLIERIAGCETKALGARVHQCNSGSADADLLRDLNTPSARWPARNRQPMSRFVRRPSPSERLMAGLTIVRRLSRIVEHLTERPGSGGRPTALRQDKSREVRPGWMVEESRDLSAPSHEVRFKAQPAFSQNRSRINNRCTSRRKPDSGSAIFTAAMALSVLKALVLLLEAPAARQGVPAKYLKPTNHMRPSRRRRFYLAVRRSMGRGSVFLPLRHSHWGYPDPIKCPSGNTPSHDRLDSGCRTTAGPSRLALCASGSAGLRP